MSKKQDFLDMSAIDTQVLNRAKKKKSVSEQGSAETVASKSKNIAPSATGGNILERTMKKSGEKLELQSQIESLKQELADQSQVISLKMPISGLTVDFKKRLVDPNLIDVSDENQREQSLLDLSAVADIFDSISDEGQSEPGYVRPISGGRYELVSGSRRLFCVKNIPGRQYLALVGDIPDVDVRRLSRLENQQTPISVYERAISFQQDINAKKVKSWDALAAMEGLSSRQIKKYKALADLPIEIARSFDSPSDLSLEFADWLISKIRRNAVVREKVLALADNLYRDKAKRIHQGEVKRSSVDIMSEYKRALRLKKPVQPTAKKPVVYTNAKGKEVMKHTVSSKGTQKLEFVDVPQETLEKVMLMIQKEMGLATQ